MLFEALSIYKPTKLEETVNRVYQQLGIEHPEDIFPERIARELGISLYDSKFGSMSAEFEGKFGIAIDVNLNEQDRREDFFHELTHLLRHAGNQTELGEDLRNIQEREANTMPYYWLMPTNMIAKCYLPDDYNRCMRYLAEYFDVHIPFVMKRMDMLYARIQMLAAEQQFAAAISSGPQLGRDYDRTVTIGRNELYYKDGRIVGHLIRNE